MWKPKPRRPNPKSRGSEGGSSRRNNLELRKDKMAFQTMLATAIVRSGSNRTINFKLYMLRLDLGKIAKRDGKILLNGLEDDIAPVQFQNL